MKRSLQKSRSTKGVQVLWVIGTVLFCSLAVFFVLSFLISRTQAVQTIQTETPVDGRVKQFYNALIANNYSDAYLLFSTNVRQQLEERGGASSLQEEMQPYNQQYGNITTYVIETQITQPGTSQKVVTVQIHRSKLQARQSEKDTLTLILEANAWVIDKWNSIITTNPT